MNLTLPTTHDCRCGRRAVGHASKRSAPGKYGRVYWSAWLCAEHAADFLDAQAWIDAFFAHDVRRNPC